MTEFFDAAAMSTHTLRTLIEFLKREKTAETAKKYDEMRFVGYVLEIGYDTATIITSDPFKVNVGGVPRNSLLIMVPEDHGKLPPHFTLLRVLESAPTPLSKEVQQTYFELQKRSMPELDVFTQSELQWGALRTGVLGMFYPHPDAADAVEFSGDINNFVSAHKYKVYAPDDALLHLVVNALVPEATRFELGKLRLTECRLPIPGMKLPNVTVNVAARDFIGARTAMFGKTRLGKSNIVKLIAQSAISMEDAPRTVGQLVFDVNGEYANDNPQDGNLSLRGANESKCVVYALSAKASTPSLPLRLNFFEQPDVNLPILASFLRQDGRASAYVQAFASVPLPSISDVEPLEEGSERIRLTRKIQIYWAILAKAAFDVDEPRLKGIAPRGRIASQFNPGFAAALRTAAYANDAGASVPRPPETLAELRRELEVLARFRRANPTDPSLRSTSGSGSEVFDQDDVTMLDFLEPVPGRSGPTVLQPYRLYHASNAGDFISEILAAIDKAMTVILDLGNANPTVLQYFSDELSRRVFNHQVDKFSNNKLGHHFVQLYFEEAHNLFPRNDDSTTIYSRFAKEGAKYHIGMVYSTQSPTTVSRDLLAQTENFFILHLSSEDDVNALAKVNVAFATMKGDIMLAKTPGYARMLTRSHRFVVSVQARKFEPVAPATRSTEEVS